MNILLFDTETTGIVNFKKPIGDPVQPHLVQLAALQIENGEETAQLNVIIKPSGFSIPPQASAVHGITTDLANKVGVPILAALSVFQALLANADLIVGHNVPFDIAVLGGEFKWNKLNAYGLDKNSYCTMRESTDIVKIRSAWGYKWPKLSEAYQFAFNEPLVDAHDAMVDLRATLRLYNWLKARTNVVEKELAEFA